MFLYLANSFKFVLNHFQNVHQGFSPMFEVEDLHNIPALDYRKLNSRFGLAFLANIFALIDFIFERFKHRKWILPDESREFMRIMTHNWPTSREQRDVIGLGGYIICVLYFFNLYFEKWPHASKFMYFTKDSPGTLVSGGKQCPSKLATILIAYWKKLGPRLAIFFGIITFNCNLAFTFIYYIGEIILPNENTLTVWNGVCLIGAPIYMTYIAFALNYSICFWLNLRLFHFKQDFYISWFRKLIDKLRRRKSQDRTLKMYFLQMRTIVSLMQEIRLYNSFWSRYISTTLLVYSMEICYIFFAMVTATTIEQRLTLASIIFFPIGYIIYIYIISSASSKIVTNNVRIHSEIRRFNIRCSRVPTYLRLKLETFDCYQRFFQKTSFKLINNYTINLKLFELLGSMILVFSLKLYGKKLAKAIF